METKAKGDLVISGFGASNGGEFHRVTLNGRGTINSDLTCEEFECKGSGTVKGNLISNQVKVSGSAKFNGSIESEKLSVEGNAKIDQNANVKELKVSGKVSIGGRVRCEEIKVQGFFSVGEDCETERFKAESRFMIGGLLNADEVNVKLFGECHVREIGGQSITVKHKASWMESLFKPLFKTGLETELIEGDKIYLENTNAKVVRGNQVKIGPNCHIGLVEYREEYSCHKKAVVEDTRKV